MAFLKIWKTEEVVFFSPDIFGNDPSVTRFPRKSSKSNGAEKERNTFFAIRELGKTIINAHIGIKFSSSCGKPTNLDLIFKVREIVASVPSFGQGIWEFAPVTIKSLH